MPHGTRTALGGLSFEKLKERTGLEEGLNEIEENLLIKVYGNYYRDASGNYDGICLKLVHPYMRRNDGLKDDRIETQLFYTDDIERVEKLLKILTKDEGF